MQLVQNNPQVQSSIAALPVGFLVTKTGTTGRQVMKPMPRSEFRKQHGYSHPPRQRALVKTHLPTLGGQNLRAIRDQHKFCRRHWLF